jgi:hypothetical protein
VDVSGRSEASLEAPLPERTASDPQQLARPDAYLSARYAGRQACHDRLAFGCPLSVWLHLQCQWHGHVANRSTVDHSAIHVYQEACWHLLHRSFEGAMRVTLLLTQVHKVLASRPKDGFSLSHAGFGQLLSRTATDAAFSLLNEMAVCKEERS